MEDRGKDKVVQQAQAVGAESELGKGRSLKEKARQPETTEASVQQKLWPRLKVDLPSPKAPD